ncbi:Stk1 family PASTA domain-containing Ser/Thr kinase [Pseudolysinimonas sp.]|uniref:Stk1 family PASTA domain-containing Ser/Thr kinase n=1 Tax=Pseudolysinimonas sp. TaxID=2680009 RepID=UPI003F7E8639
MSVNTSDPVIGRLIDGRYQVRSRIARGGMATVYLATDLRLERRVAVKVMHGHLADDSQFKQRFIQEARSAARLAHPNVVNVFDQGQDDDSAYLVMEYLPGITLRDLLREYGSLTPQQAIDIAEAVLSGLAAAHKAGIVHRDLKPENVLLADDGRIKIGDFGLARAASANTATGAALLGTIAYLSPELVTRGVADTRSDIYAVGIMMYEMLTGEQPFTGEQPMQIAYQHANESVPAPSSRNPKVPRPLDELVLWATERDPERRPRDAREMLEQLKAVAGEIDGTGPAPTVAQRTMVLPSPPGAARPFADDETQVLGARGAMPTARTATTDQVPVRQAVEAGAPRKRRPRRWIPLLVILVLLALIGGGAGWWFLAGPGSQVAIPQDLQGKTPEAATAELRALGLELGTPGQAYSTSVAAGRVADTKPGLGSFVGKGSTVRLLVSAGRKPIPFSIKAGTPVADAEAAIKANWSSGGDPKKQFSDSIAADQVIDALGADGKSLLGQATYGQGLPVTLVESVGKLPDVTGQTFAQAQDALNAVHVTATQGEQSFSHTVPEGSVIKIETAGPYAPGQTIALTISKGPEPVVVPSVVGQTWAKAKQQLLDAGFQLDYNPKAAADAFPSIFVVTKTDPDGGSTAPWGSTIKVNLRAGG